MARYTITVTQTCAPGDLDHDDRSEFGEHEAGDVVRTEECTARSEDDALDRFHDETPIACLDNYDIQIEEV